MKTKNRLGKVIYDLLITRQSTSMQITEARDLLLEDYRERYNYKTLYKHLHQQLEKMERHGYIAFSTNEPSGRKVFEVTKKFSPNKFILSSTTKFFDEIDDNSREQNSEDNYDRDFLFLVFQQKAKKIEKQIATLNQQLAECKRIMNSKDPGLLEAANEFFNQTVDSAEKFIVNAMSFKK